jgi:magnesium transporter
MFESTIAAFTLLAVYMPIVAGMGGNAGTQSMAVAVRGIALRKISLGNGMQLIRREIIAGAINGAINGLIVAAVATFINQSPRLGLVLGIAMVVNLIVAGLFGSLVPLIMKRLGKDPATSATIFITTATDVFGFLVFLGLATLLL